MPSGTYQEVLKALEEYQVNIDGKVLRATGKRGKKTAAICIVSAWASEHCVSLGQVKTDKKSNEKTAIRNWLKRLMCVGHMVSIDAMGCDRRWQPLYAQTGAITCWR
ncbi:MAG: ISAs1 family transposase [Saprospiraceae bacterium]